MKKNIEELTTLLTELLLSNDKLLIKEKIIKLMPLVYFGMDSKSEEITKTDIINDIDNYIKNNRLKKQIEIRIFFLTKLLKNA